MARWISTAWSSSHASSRSAPPWPPSKQEMAAFFERLSTEQDPTRIAAMAERMPEPPDLAGVAAAIVEPTSAPVETLVDDAPAAEGDGSEMTDSEASAESGETAEISDGSETETGEAETVEARRDRGVRARLRRRRSRSRRLHRRRRGRRQRGQRAHPRPTITSPPPPHWQRPPTTARRRASAQRPA